MPFTHMFFEEKCMTKRAYRVFQLQVLMKMHTVIGVLSEDWRMQGIVPTATISSYKKCGLCFLNASVVKVSKNMKKGRAFKMGHKKIGWIDIDNSDKMEEIDVAKGRSVEIVNVISESEYKRIYYGLNVSMCSMYAPIVKFIKNTGVRAEELAIKEEDIAGNTLKIRRTVKRKEDVKGHSKLVVTEVLKSSSAYRTVPLNDEAKKQ